MYQKQINNNKIPGGPERKMQENELTPSKLSVQFGENCNRFGELHGASLATLEAYSFSENQTYCGFLSSCCQAFFSSSILWWLEIKGNCELNDFHVFCFCFLHVSISAHFL